MVELVTPRIPILQAPMAGGPSTVALAAAVCRAGGMGFLAAGYKTPEEVAEQVDQLRARTSAPFGVNLFVPQPVPDPEAVAAYRDELADDATRYGVRLPAVRPDDEDDFSDKVALLVTNPVPVVSCTFGVPQATLVRALHQVGSAVLVTVTSAAEARIAAEAGADGLCVQGPEAGGHRGVFDQAADPGHTPLPELLAAVGRETSLPLIAAGGIATGADIAAALRGGARAVQLGTAYLRTPESGANATYKAALADSRFDETIVTRAFSGRPARGLRNRFIDAHDATAPAGYPLVNQLTKPLRAAATRQHDPDGISLWAGTRHRHTTDEPAGELTVRLWDATQA